MPNRLRAFALLAPLALVAACGDGAEDVPVDDGAGAEGEVLGGSISDDMIALDQLRSQSPPLEDQPASGDAPSGDAPAASDAPAPDPPDDGAAEEPAAEPEAEQD